MHIGEKFQEETKYQYMRSHSDMVMGTAVPPGQKAIPPDQEIIKLPQTEGIKDNAALDVMMNRRSRRSYSEKPVSFKELSMLLTATQRVVESGPGYSLRAAPSAGARHPLETYLCINRVDSLEPGLYLYLPFDHALIPMRSGTDVSTLLRRACLDQIMLERSAVNFIWTAVIDRSRWKYQQRAYRYIYLDAGHNCQNLYLACEALGTGCCAIAAFDDDAVNHILSVDGIEEFAIYLATVGHVK